MSIMHFATILLSIKTIKTNEEIKNVIWNYYCNCYFVSMLSTKKQNADTLKAGTVYFKSGYDVDTKRIKEGKCNYIIARATGGAIDLEHAGDCDNRNCIYKNPN